MTIPEDLTGRRFGTLTVVAPVCRVGPKRDRQSYFICSCDCGKSDYVTSRTHLISKTRKVSCGCRQGATHGHKRATGMSLTYQSWRGAKERCLSPKHIQYRSYGGRGIQICSRWLGPDGFSNFLEDMGERPSKDHSIDRIDSNGNYEPSNCRWLTRKEQSRNKTNNKIWIYEGAKYCESELCEQFNINLRTFRHRIQLGWSLSDALLKPVQERKTI